jgi:hypothetical protein
MPSSDPDHPDYECPRCFSPAYPCLCMKSKIDKVVTAAKPLLGLEAEVKALYQRYRKHKKKLESPNAASENGLTYLLLDDGSIEFSRWAYNPWRPSRTRLNDLDQEIARGVFNQLVAVDAQRRPKQSAGTHPRVTIG